MQSLGANWLVLSAPSDRSIPEVFIRGLLAGGIIPILHFNTSLPSLQKNKDIPTFLATYAKWGVQYVIFGDRPNTHQAWSAATWAQEDLVERFLDIFLPLAESAVKLGMIPVLPPLEPGGSYWDTTFLQSLMQSLVRREKNDLLDTLVVSAYAWTHGKPLSFGAGGPERWAGARPYFTPVDEEDQRGFNIFEWYESLINASLGKSLPIMLLGTGIPGNDLSANAPEISEAEHATINMAITRAYPVRMSMILPPMARPSPPFPNISCVPTWPPWQPPRTPRPPSTPGSNRMPGICPRWVRCASGSPAVRPVSTPSRLPG